MRAVSIRTLLACITLIAAACSSSSVQGVTPLPPTAESPPPVASPSAVSPSISNNPSADAVLDAALVDAATRLGVSRNQLQVQQVEPREWPDASLGCPQPGEMYSQIVTPGFVITIGYASRVLEYHTDTRVRVKLCRES